ncbi:hypothetical protein ElyMa_002018500 [Elysia marginata]|uniref:Uncharacterized protein n=1 Tax=Elysia marginata TaxID=1093978 RepID=A0AAV4F4L8_9GAST|nr:hypothetical protein ElyMa_002018500 [Elysia marginata]
MLGTLVMTSETEVSGALNQPEPSPMVMGRQEPCSQVLSPETVFKEAAYYSPWMIESAAQEGSEDLSSDFAALYHAGAASAGRKPALTRPSVVTSITAKEVGIDQPEYPTTTAPVLPHLCTEILHFSSAGTQHVKTSPWTID